LFSTGEGQTARLAMYCLKAAEVRRAGEITVFLVSLDVENRDVV
jgi:hypothetical protein